MEWENAVGKVLPTDLFDAGFHKISICKKCSGCQVQ